MTNVPCPLCTSSIRAPYNIIDDSTTYDCPRCGKFVISVPGIADLNDKKALLSHEIRKMQRDGYIPDITPDRLEILLKKELPGAKELADNLVVWLGENLPAIGEDVNVLSYPDLMSVIGAKTIDSLDMIIDHLHMLGLLANDEERTIGAYYITLSVSGWEYYEQLKRETKDSRIAFMAMKFGNPTLDSMVEDYFKDAVTETGYSLVKLDDVPVAGLIDDRMRVEIRKSRFLIADLTHGNNGAYWESGFAEGLGKPVIYTCEKSKWESEKSHFDTNHLLTVPWDKDNPSEAVERLKATIRATLPSEAKLSDD